MSIYLVTSANGPYMPKMRPYLESLQARLNPEIEPVCMCVDCDAPEWAADVPRVRFVPMTSADNYGTSESTSVEHGSFLPLVPGDFHDVMIYTNGDLALQRPLTAWEMRQLETFPHGSWSAGWNAGYGDTLGGEATRLQPKVDAGTRARWFPGHERVPCFNMGVVIARRMAYADLYHAYLGLWPRVEDAFRHYARQQWGVCYAADEERLHFIEMSPALHAHGHYGVPLGVDVLADGTAVYRGEAVAWRHKL